MRISKVLCLALLLSYFVQGAHAQPLDKVVAVVNDNVITESELNAQIAILKQQLLAKQMQLPPEATLRKQVLQHLIDEDLQLQLAKNNGITVDSTDLDSAIAKIASENHLSLTQLREELSKQGLGWDAYRETIRKEMLINRIQQRSVGKEIVVSSQQVSDYLKTARHNEKTQQLFHLENLVIPLPEAPTTEQVSQAHEKARLLLSKIKPDQTFNQLAIAESTREFPLEGGDLGERHLAEMPEIFAEKVIDMQVGDVAGPIRTGNGFQLLKLVSINENQQRHEVQKTHVRHILLKQDANMTEAAATKQINNIYQQLKSGKDFALVAKQYSLDSASAAKGGDLGWVVSEDLVPSFATAMNALPLHTISQPVKSQFGWHLIEVLERKTVDDSKLFQRQQVRQFLQQRKFAEAVQNWQQHIRTDSYINIMDKELA
jgi:peptidyl-prolyl cis-trans isomerase SurA